MKIGVVNYGMGNISSVCNAIEFLGHTAENMVSSSQVKSVDKIILPGVGAFQEGMTRLRDNEWIDALQTECLNKGKPLLGICLGMQLLADEGYEFGHCAGLGFIAGSVNRINFHGRYNYRLPHIGWNTIKIEKKESKIFIDIEKETDMYFVHSYVFEPLNKNVISGICEYGVDFVASIEEKNIFGTQFHPEKSHKQGLKILDNFIMHGGE